MQRLILIILTQAISLTTYSQNTNNPTSLALAGKLLSSTISYESNTSKVSDSQSDNQKLLIKVPSSYTKKQLSKEVRIEKELPDKVIVTCGLTRVRTESKSEGNETTYDSDNTFEQGLVQKGTYQYLYNSCIGKWSKIKYSSAYAPLDTLSNLPKIAYVFNDVPTLHPLFELNGVLLFHPTKLLLKKGDTWTDSLKAGHNETMVSTYTIESIETNQAKINVEGTRLIPPSEADPTGKSGTMHEKSLTIKGSLYVNLETGLISSLNLAIQKEYEIKVMTYHFSTLETGKLSITNTIVK
ncbi:MAG: DUF6263 family protein [Siphonobacter sp.]